MRRTAALIAILAALTTPVLAADRAAERVDAQMLLDLDLLAEADPMRHRDQSVAERLRMLEMLGLLESPAAATSSGRPAAPAGRTSPPPAAPTEGGTR